MSNSNHSKAEAKRQHFFIFLSNFLKVSLTLEASRIARSSFWQSYRKSPQRQMVE